MWSAERINPDRQDTKPFALQTSAEYRFIRDRVTGLNVADIGCGSGYGSAILAEVRSACYGSRPICRGHFLGRGSLGQLNSNLSLR